MRKTALALILGALILSACRDGNESQRTNDSGIQATFYPPPRNVAQVQSDHFHGMIIASPTAIPAEIKGVHYQLRDPVIQIKTKNPQETGRLR